MTKLLTVLGNFGESSWSRITNCQTFVSECLDNPWNCIRLKESSWKNKLRRAPRRRWRHPRRFENSPRAIKAKWRPSQIDPGSSSNWKMLGTASFISAARSTAKKNQGQIIKTWTEETLTLLRECNEGCDGRITNIQLIAIKCTDNEWHLDLDSFYESCWKK